MSRFLFLVFSCGTALLPLLYFLLKAIRFMFSVQRRKHKSVEAKARILYAAVRNERFRTVPFAKLKVEVFACDGQPFTADAEGFYSHNELHKLKSGAVVCVRYLPEDKTQVQLIKKQVPTKKENRLFVKEDGEIISTAISPVQSPAARHRRLTLR